MGTITRTFANQIKTGGKLDADGLDLTDTFAFTGTVTGAGSPSIDDNGTATAITIDSSENVGIKNVSPSATFDVTGTIFASGRVAKNTQAWSTFTTAAETLTNLVLDGTYSSWLFTILGTSTDTLVENRGLYFLTRTNTGYQLNQIYNSGGGTLSHSSGTLTFASPTSSFRTWRASLLRLH